MCVCVCMCVFADLPWRNTRNLPKFNFEYPVMIWLSTDKTFFNFNTSLADINVVINLLMLELAGYVSYFCKYVNETIRFKYFPKSFTNMLMIQSDFSISDFFT